MARENEIRCLNKVREALLTADSSFSLYSDVDKESIRDLFASALENNEPNDFPDFFCNGGFIEHFEISASKEDKKGSEFRREESKAASETKAQLEQWNSEFLKSEFKPDTIRSGTIENRYEGFSHQDFISSLRRNVTSHLESLKQHSMGGFKNSVFLAENAGGRLCVFEHGAFKRFYSIHTDRKALEVLRTCVPFVRYFVFVACDYIEILDLAKLDEMTSQAPENLDIRSGRHREITLGSYIDLSPFFKL